jgi:unsaturated chondroitin disaccharide hydrolase
MKRKLVLLLLAAQWSWAQEINVPKTVAFAEGQAKLQLAETQKRQDGNKVSPRTLDEKGNLELVPSWDWTSGFFPGVLWQLYHFTGKNEWQIAARQATEVLQKEQFNNRTHDMGFKMYCSFGKGFEYTGDTTYRNILIQSAKTLITRFNPAVGAIRSWDHNKDKWSFPVIIDNMMNLELLFAATRWTGDSTYYRIAVAHANTTLRNHFRPDGSTYHVIGYDPNSGEVIKRHTHQGYAHNSTWARGQAWALYGYTMCYRETGIKAYLDKALEVAEWFKKQKRWPKDQVPYWDFDAPGDKQPRDASAAAIIASALYELDEYAPKSSKLGDRADAILSSLLKNYTAPAGTNAGFLLLHSTGHLPHNSEIDVPIIYADYYLLEALDRKKERKK